MLFHHDMKHYRPVPPLRLGRYVLAALVGLIAACVMWMALQRIERWDYVPCARECGTVRA